MLGCTACRSTFLSLFGRVFARFYFYNVLAELDAEGEYFVDKTTATLYWKPASPTAPAGAAGAAGLSAVVSVLSTVVSAVNVTGVQFIGLSFLHARGDGLQVAGSAGVEVLGGTIANHGELGVNITNSSNVAVSGCAVEQTGSGAAWLEGGYRDALISANLTLQRCSIRRVSRWERFPPGRGAGATLHGVGHTVRENSFTGLPHQNIRIYGNDHLVDNCTFRNALWETASNYNYYHSHACKPQTALLFFFPRIESNRVCVCLLLGWLAPPPCSRPRRGSGAAAAGGPSPSEAGVLAH